MKLKNLVGFSLALVLGLVFLVFASQPAAAGQYCAGSTFNCNVFGSGSIPVSCSSLSVSSCNSTGAEQYCKLVYFTDNVSGFSCYKDDCGGSGEDCCPGNNSCDSGLVCVNSTCRSCGGNSQPCCDNNTCDSGYVCNNNGVCKPSSCTDECDTGETEKRCSGDWVQERTCDTSGSCNKWTSWNNLEWCDDGCITTGGTPHCATPWCENLTCGRSPCGDSGTLSCSATDRIK